MNDARPPAEHPADRRQPTSGPVLREALKWGGVSALAIAVVGGLLGWLFAGAVGLTSALLGTAIAIGFMAITAASILLANRFSASDLFVGAFFGIVLGGWLLKFVLFIVLVVLLRGQPWLDSTVLFLSIVAGVIASLVVDVIVVLRSRVPYASDVELPKAPTDD
ncbi:hypothetical protein ARHIZOSPH14_02280 [Agromyces rhizosphaerae]|uniref:Uncharacterized protein n=1 Tax=Agromyces rhizosphaerae TaxID=88374 RepID=A0A9W6CTW4_9MICO|nr:hypothetical protein [Agromyces rhizosphaerae]GLI25986.1 hypothetical protein ARHIZOSPH14_02280 [Agromyces rhizosphaerae]